MNWKNTWLLVGVAAALFAFIYLYERHLTTSDTVATPPPVLSDFKASLATRITLRKGNVNISLERTNGGAWRYTQPFNYPAASLAVDGLLRLLELLIPSTHITPQEIIARKQTEADFGFDNPGITISLKAGQEEQKLWFGARTPANDQVYLDVVGKPGHYVVNAAILDHLPRTANDWRDTTLLYLPEQKVDLVDISRPSGTGGFTAQRDPTNQLWRLTRPAHRVDQLQVQDLLKRLEETRIATFVTDEPRVDLDGFGLQPPIAELTLGSGAQRQKVQFGRAPPNDPTRIYARQVNATNIVLVPATIGELLGTPYIDLRDRRLVAFPPEAVDVIEVRSPEPFVTKRQPNGTWTVAEAAVDSPFVNDWITSVSQLAVRAFVKDVVDTFTPFALDPPVLRMILRSTTTNGTTVTNVVVADLAFGTNHTPDTIYARRMDEESVYSIHILDYLHLPSAPWQLRDHRVWSFATNQVARVVVRQDNRTVQLLRQNGQWASTTGKANQFALEEIMFVLSELRTPAWVAHGEAALSKFGFAPTNYSVSIDLKEGDKTRTLTVQFGGAVPLRLAPGQLSPLNYATTTVDGEPWVFEFPWAVYVELQRDLAVPLTGAEP